MTVNRLFLFSLLAIFLSFPVHGLEISVDTSNLDSWEPLTFPKIKAHSTFRAVKEDQKQVIRIESDASASAIIYSETFSLSETPYLQWSWKVRNIFKAGNAAVKAGDDYPVRIYILFKYSPDRVPFFQRLPFELAKTLYGEYPPAEVLNYVWANRSHDVPFMENAFTNRAMMFFPDEGGTHVGQWRSHKVNIIKDFKKAFKRSPPDTFTLAIMGDSDNTGESSVSFVSGITLSAE